MNRSAPHFISLSQLSVFDPASPILIQVSLFCFHLRADLMIMAFPCLISPASSLHLTLATSIIISMPWKLQQLPRRYNTFGACGLIRQPWMYQHRHQQRRHHRPFISMFAKRSILMAVDLQRFTRMARCSITHQINVRHRSHRSSVANGLLRRSSAFITRSPPHHPSHQRIETTNCQIQRRGSFFSPVLSQSLPLCL